MYAYIYICISTCARAQPVGDDVAGEGRVPAPHEQLVEAYVYVSV